MCLFDREMQTILVTGGVGYIGSHTVLALLDCGFEVVILDNLSNSSIKCLDKVKQLAGDKAQFITFYEVDLLDKPGMEAIFQKHTFKACIHFAGKKAVNESVRLPLVYYENNITGSTYLLQIMDKYGCKNIVFSSSCTVYGEPNYVPLDEGHSLNAISPYGRTKLYIEEMMKDLCFADAKWSVALLRYFNPVGSHPSGLIGEDPVGIPNNLMPFVQQVAVGRREKLNVFGSDYKTRDGTCIRDYIHVCDLADAHVAALKQVLADDQFGCKPINLGTGTGTTVLEMVSAFEKACGKKLPYQLADRRAGDTVAVWADTTYATQVLGWKAKFTIEDACRDQWNWASKNPYGFNEAPTSN